MSRLRFMTSDRTKVCKLCADEIRPHTWCLVMEEVHVSPKVVNLFFHEGCFMRALEHAKATRNDSASPAEPIKE